MPTILPPKRRRSAAEKKCLTRGQQQAEQRIAREFPQHNWLEKKLTDPSHSKGKSQLDNSTGTIQTSLKGTSPTATPNLEKTESEDIDMVLGENETEKKDIPDIGTEQCNDPPLSESDHDIFKPDPDDK